MARQPHSGIFNKGYDKTRNKAEQKENGTCGNYFSRYTVIHTHFGLLIFILVFSLILVSALGAFPRFTIRLGDIVAYDKSYCVFFTPAFCKVVVCSSVFFFELLKPWIIRQRIMLNHQNPGNKKPG